MTTVGFWALLGAFAGATLLTKFLGGTTSFLLLLYGPILLTAATLSLIAGVLWRPTLAKARRGAAHLLLGLGLVGLTPWIARVGDRLFFLVEREGLERLAGDLRADGRIDQLSDGLRHFKELNGELVAYEASAVDTLVLAGQRPTLPIELVLEHAGIDRATYDRYRQRLHAVRMIEVVITPSYVAYLYDGILDNLEGYLLVHPGASPPPVGSELFKAEIVGLRPLGGGWYQFTTT